MGLSGKDLEDFKNYIGISRKQLLDILEIAFGDQPNWTFIRSKILNFYGRSGIEGQVDLLLQKHRMKERSIEASKGTICPGSQSKKHTELCKLNHAIKPKE